MKKRSSKNWRSLNSASLHFKARLASHSFFFPRCLLAEYQIGYSTICFIALKYGYGRGTKWVISHFEKMISKPEDDELNQQLEP